MKKKRIILAVIALILVVLLALTAVFGLSFTRDSYACYSCKSLGRSEALRVFGFPIWKGRVRLTHSVTGKSCKHHWEWYFASSTGILLNRQNWDGPIGIYPFAEELQKQSAENKQV